MNVFKFNNERIAAMNQSLNLKYDMAKSMKLLEDLIKQWNTEQKKLARKKTIKKEIKEIKEIKEEKKSIEIKEIKEVKEEEKKPEEPKKPKLKLW